MPHTDFTMRMIFSPSSRNGLFIISIIIIIIILVFDRETGGTPLAAQLGPWGSPLWPWGGRPRVAGRRGPPLSLWLTHRLINGRTEADKFTGRRVPFQPKAISCPLQDIGGATARVMGHQPFLGHEFVLVMFGLANFKGDQNWERSQKEKRANTKHRSGSPTGLFAAS